MLLKRSITLQLLLLINFIKGQEYESEYTPEYEGGDDSSNYQEGEEGKPDYSKYYSTDTSSPVIQSKSDTGFVTPLDFGSFFGAANFELGASSNPESSKTQKLNGFVSPHELQSGFADFRNNNPFGGQDYFEQAQKQAATEDEKNFEVKPGPSYVSHKIVPPGNQEYKEPLEQKKNSKNNVYKTVKPINIEKEYENPNQNYEFGFKPIPVQYPVSKQTVIDPKYLPQYPTQVGKQITPYQKYSFQPTNSELTYTPALQNYNNFKYTTVIPNYEYSPSEYVSKKVNYKNCKKIEKEGRNGMDCYICKDPKSGTNYEECSYANPTNPKNYYVEATKSYSNPSILDSYRYKRYSNKNDKDDPYEYIKAQSQKYYSKPENFESEYKPSEYRFGPEYFSDDDEEKSSSEKESEALVKNGENCQKVHKDNMICMICKNSKSGGNYEQCSYSSKPNEKKYAYVKERKYDSNDEPEEETESSEDKPIKEKQVYGRKRKGEKSRKPVEVEHVRPISTNKPSPSETRNAKYRYEVPEHFEENNRRNSQKPVSRNYKEDKSDHYEEEKEKPLESPDKDEYYYKFFPEYSKEESKRNEQQSDPESYGYYGEGDRKDVEEVLAEFAKKDRSQCKKAEKNGMTCYLCTDKNGLQNEECMYVSESRPQSTFSSYHAKQETPEQDKQQSEIQATEVVNPKSRRFPKKATTPNPVTTQWNKVTTPLPPRNIRITTPGTITSSQRTKVVRQYKRTKNIHSTAEPETAETKVENDEYRTDGNEGAFSDETKPVYSKVLGFSLPKFMLTKSEGEIIYDELANSKY